MARKKTKAKTSAKAKTNVNKKVSKKAKSKKKGHPPFPYKQELWAIALFLLSVFIFVSNQFPESTGAIGHYVVQLFGRKLIGDAIEYLPLFLVAPSILFLFSKQKTKISIFASLISFAAFTVATDLYKTQIIMPNHSTEITGGGYIGQIGNFILVKSVGPLGASIVLFGIISLSLLIVFNMSVKNVIFNLFGLIRRFKPESFIQDLKHVLFYSPPKQPSLPEPTFKNRNTHLQAIPNPKFELPQFTETQAEMPKAIETRHEKPMEPNDDSITIEKNELTVQKPKIEALREVKAISRSVENYQFPPISLLEKPHRTQMHTKETAQLLREKAIILEKTLQSFNVNAKVVNITPGPSVTRFELKPGVGVKISKITALSNDIALKLSAADVRIEAPIPGKALVGIEVPNSEVETITLRDIINRTDFFERESKLVCGIGLTITGEAIIMDINKMPHVLIAGATGAGKSVCVNTLILSILLRATPDEVKFLMIDPKKVELSLYEDIPHLIAPVVTDPNKAAATLKQWALIEMERRYEQFSKAGVKDILTYNKWIEKLNQLAQSNPDEARKKYLATFHLDDEYHVRFPLNKIPFIVVIIDELADLMMVAAQDVESTICRLAQMARATGIHLVIATQRPSVNVVTGLIKANVPSRISFYLQSQIDSRTVLDMGGAEKLLGRGDMLYSPVGSFKPIRVQGVYASEKEIKAVVKFVRKQGKPNYLQEVMEVEPLKESGKKGNDDPDGRDELYEEAKNIVMNSQYASTSYLQRKLRIGYNRAARIMDELTEDGVISDYAGEKKSRTVIPN